MEDDLAHAGMGCFEALDCGHEMDIIYYIMGDDDDDNRRCKSCG